MVRQAAMCPVEDRVEDAAPPPSFYLSMLPQHTETVGGWVPTGGSHRMLGEPSLDMLICCLAPASTGVTWNPRPLVQPFLWRGKMAQASCFHERTGRRTPGPPQRRLASRNGQSSCHQRPAPAIVSR